MYACHNIVADVEPDFIEAYEDKKQYWGKMPIDKMRGNFDFSTMGSMWGMSLRWGDEYTEPVEDTPVGQVRPEDIVALRKVGQKVRDDMLLYNKYYRVIIRRKV